MLGSLLVSKFQLDVMSRASIEPEKREPFRLYVDEFQNFATDSFSDIFSFSLKYGLALVIAHQYMNQVSPQLMDDATITPQLLVEQPLYNFTLKSTQKKKKRVSHGELLHPSFIGERNGLQNSEKLQSLVREKFAKDRKFVEDKLNTKMS